MASSSTSGELGTMGGGSGSSWRIRPHAGMIRPRIGPRGLHRVASNHRWCPDPNYQVIPQPVSHQMLAQPIAAGNGVTQQFADAGNALAGTISQLASLEEASHIALDRAETAHRAKDGTWYW